MVGPEVAVVQNYEKGENTNADGKPQVVSIRATSVFRKEGGQWKMIGHHTDPLPYLEK
jgi:ketosteroid isomerase-like protein